MHILIILGILMNVHAFKEKHFTEPGLKDLLRKINGLEGEPMYSRVKRNVFVYHKKNQKEMVEEQFKEYEKCLKKREEERNEGKNTIRGLLVLEGQSVRLSCNLCQRPDQDFAKLQIIDWQQLRRQDSDFVFVDHENGRVKIDKSTRDLIFDAVDVLDAGQYFCINTYYREYEEIYQLDVLFKERLKTTKYEDIAQGKDKFLGEYWLKDRNIRTFTAWSEWTDCQDCNKKSIKRRVGLCMVNKIDKNLPVLPYDLPVLDLYPSGVPCRSTVLSKDLASVKRIKMRRSEVCLADCYKNCPTTPGYTLIKDKNGKVIETVEAGFYSLKKPPTLPPMVVRKVLYEPVNKHLILKCPKSQKSKALIRWQNNTIVLNPLTIRRQTRGRVFIDTINRLHIRRLRMTDTAPYNCWSSTVHLATIKVIVHEAYNDIKIKEYITLTGLGLTIFSISCILICTVCKGRKKKKRKK
ncbi:Ig-like V-type domain-containing protein FAM187A [Saccostrea echinata]|uniref:Ig-like V-type domain-containing protein FAM187A n=1 Tax=Saccostrea echinata TaxID=191078 RepID=UPI002A826860|nr:Ig-like V-type domain-containing protein FAM187A [Saccostrea echinata]